MAGEYKRTLSLFGENTDSGREKFRQEIEETHTLFKAFIAENRPGLDMAKIATGEHWYGSQAMELKLIDQLITSDDYLLSTSKKADIYEVKYTIKKSLSERLSASAHIALKKLWLSWQTQPSNHLLY
jgi:serine protease SohB